MERLLEIASRKADKVEIYSRSDVADGVRFENGRLKDVESSMLSGIGLTLMKDGRLGTAYTRNLIDREALVESALAALTGGVEADYDLSPAASPAGLDAWDPKIEELTTAAMVEECGRQAAHLGSCTKGQVNVSAARGISTTRVLNSEGFDQTVEGSSYQGYFAIHYPGSYASIHRAVSAKSFIAASREDLDEAADVFNASEKELRPRSGRTRALFLPGAMYALVWRLAAATTGRTVYEKVSPLRERMGEQVASSLLTLTDAPLDDSQPEARSFDDEGTTCRDKRILDEGVLRGFYTDRYYADKLDVQPSGNGYRSDITARPAPSLEHLRIEPGELSFTELLRELKEGVVVGGALGAHSGNILNGDYSIGLSPGLWVENGEIAGHVKDSMIAGNVYEDLHRVVALGSRLEPASMGRFPALLLDDLSFSTRG